MEFGDAPICEELSTSLEVEHTSFIEELSTSVELEDTSFSEELPTSASTPQRKVSMVMTKY